MKALKPQPRHSSFAPSALVTFAAALLLVGCSSTEPSGDNNSSQVKGSSSSKTGTSLSFSDADLAKNDQSCEFDEVANLLKCKEKHYKTVKIGDQIWMAENLNYGEFISTEDIVPNGYSRFQIGSVKFCYDNDESNCDHYGGLYQWHTAMGLELSCGDRTRFCGDQVSEGHHQGICPKGWHIPSREEALALKDYQYTIAYYGGGAFYLDPSEGGTNETGFSALYSGECRHTGRFVYLHEVGNWWTTETKEDPIEFGEYRLASAFIYSYGIISAYSLRCVKDY